MTETRKHRQPKGVIIPGETLTLSEWLTKCKTNPSMYATAAERMLKAIGSPEIIDTKTHEDPRLARIFCNRVIKRYSTFKDFYGMEEVIEQIVKFFISSAQGTEERKQILYLLGPVGGGKSSLAERLKYLMTTIPIWVVAIKKDDGTIVDSPVFESPLELFDPEDDGPWLEAEYGIPRRLLVGVRSPWAKKRLSERNHDPMNFHVAMMYPSKDERGGVAVAKTEPGDENNQDISTLVGKMDISLVGEFAESDPDAYAYTGGLCHGNQGILEFVEMFKAPIKMLHPLLTATQESNYNGTKNVGALPFTGIILAHSNEAEWQSFSTNKKNEAFLDRVFIIKVPYVLSATEEAKIYQKLIDTSSLRTAPCAPGTVDFASRFTVLTRMVEPENSSIYSKMRIYDGQSLKDVDPKAKTYQEYKDAAGHNERMKGLSTRFMFKVISAVFNFEVEEVAANPVHLFRVIEDKIGKSDEITDDQKQKYMTFMKEYLVPEYVDRIEKEIQQAYLESYAEYGQNLFERYVMYADCWIQDEEYRDPDTGETWDRAALNHELEKIEKPAGISNPKDFRNEIVHYVLRARANSGGQSPRWTSYEKLREVIEKRMFANTEDLLPVISFNAKATDEDRQKHEKFVERMRALGYTPRQVRLVCEWYFRVRKSS